MEILANNLTNNESPGDTSTTLPPIPDSCCICLEDMQHVNQLGPKHVYVF